MRKLIIFFTLFFLIMPLTIHADSKALIDWPVDPQYRYISEYLPVNYCEEYPTFSEYFDDPLKYLPKP